MMARYINKKIGSAADFAYLISIFTLQNHWLTLYEKQKKRMRNSSSKHPKMPTNCHSRGFGTQWAVRGSNPRPAD